MANLKAAAVFARSNFLYTPAFTRDDNKSVPERIGGAAALLALVPSPKGDRMFLHLMRHTDRANLRKAVPHFTKVGVDPSKWVEVDYRAYTVSGTLMSTEGELFKAGWDNTSDDEFTDIDDDTSRNTVLKPQVKRFPNGLGFSMREVA